MACLMQLSVLPGQSETPGEVKTLLNTSGFQFEEAPIDTYVKALLLNFYSPSLEYPLRCTQRISRRKTTFTALRLYGVCFLRTHSFFTNVPGSPHPSSRIIA